MDLRFKPGSTMLVCGSSKSGKSCLVMEMLSSPEIFVQPSALLNTYYFYREWNEELFTDALQKGIVKKFFNFNPAAEDVRELARPHKLRGSTIIIDDWQFKLTKTTHEIFSMGKYCGKEHLFLY